MKDPLLSKLTLAFSTAALAALLCACPDTGVVCSAGLSRCGAGCADLGTDPHNCGGCAAVCGSGQVCQSGACECQPGATRCGDACAITDSDPAHCGACGKPCAANEVCETGECKAACVLGTSTRCGQSCVNLTRDPGHCGGCDTECDSPQSCHAGVCTYDVVAACGSNGQLTGVQALGDLKGPNEAFGTMPGALASLQDVLLVGDGTENRLYQARLTSVDGHAFAKYPDSARTGAIPNQVLVEDPYIYVVNAAGGSLQVLLRGGALVADAGPADAGPEDAGAVDAGGDDAGAVDAGADDAGEVDAGGIDAGIPDAGPADAGAPDAGAPDYRLDGGHFPNGLQYATVAELAFGANTYPEAMAHLGNFLYVPLYGGMYGATAAAGQKVVKVDISDPTHPTVAGTYDLTRLDLKQFDGGNTTVARPLSITAHQGKLYVALNNLNGDTYVPEGPGLLARIDPALSGDAAMSTVDLGPTCLEALAVISDGQRLYVSCQGKAKYDSSWALESVEKTAVVALENDAVVASWTPACPAGAGPFQADGGGCLPVSVGKLATVGAKLYVADQSGGRIFVLEGANLVERRGYSPVDGGAPIQACAVNPATRYSNVSDLLSVP